MRKNNKSSTLSILSSRIPSNLDEDFSSFVEAEVQEFYQHILELASSITAEVDSFDVLEENGKKFAVYNIAVSASFMNYNVTRRYSQFYMLREKLMKSYADLNIQNIPFPEKKIFGNLQESTLNDRKTIFNEFIASICARIGHSPIIEFWEFLDLRVRYSLEIRKMATFPQKVSMTRSKSEENYILFNLIEQLNKDALEITNTLKEIDKFYSHKKPRLGPETAKTLLLGGGKAKGLLYFCGKIDKESNTHLSCSVGLPLLLSLMSYDNNREAEIYQEIFANCGLKYIKALNLEHHLAGESQRRCKQPALQLVDIYINKNPTTDLESLLSDPQARQEFLKWKYPRQNNSRKNEKFKIIEANSPLISLKQKRINIVNTEKLLSPSSQHTQETEETSSSSPKRNFAKTEALFEQITDENSWTKISTREANLCQIKHQNFVNIGFQITVKGKPEDCIPFLTERLSWMPNFHEVSYKKNEEKGYFEKYVKFKSHDGDINYVSFISKVQINEDENGVINITEKALDKKDIKPADNEVQGSRNCKVSLVPITNSFHQSQTKIKIIIKNLDNVSKRFLVNEIFRDIHKTEESLYNLKSFIERNFPCNNLTDVFGFQFMVKSEFE